MKARLTKEERRRLFEKEALQEQIEREKDELEYHQQLAADELYQMSSYPYRRDSGPKTPPYSPLVESMLSSTEGDEIRSEELKSNCASMDMSPSYNYLMPHMTPISLSMYGNSGDPMLGFSSLASFQAPFGSAYGLGMTSSNALTFGSTSVAAPVR